MGLPLIVLLLSFFSIPRNISTLEITRSYTFDSLGACQGISFINGSLYLYGDREKGVIRKFSVVTGDSIFDLHEETSLTIKGKDIINHPTGIAYHQNLPVFIGNSIRLNPEGTLWRAVIYQVDWENLLKTGTLDGNLISEIEDDACVQGTRPEYVEYNKKWYVATADYGNKRNEVRLYDPQYLKKANRTSDSLVLYKKFTCSPWVQNLCWIPEKKILVLIQNQIEGRKWRFTFVDLPKSIEKGEEVVISKIDVDGREDELEGFCLINKKQKGIAVSSSRSKNVNLIDLKWK
ncbi:MAG: hypothetical protein EBX50_15720 [Chitinophagia bacterium]|nr:hypothetical protein [Chitinophagia bacterium]